jgi:Flp pilus assembly protein TadB
MTEFQTKVDPTLHNSQVDAIIGTHIGVHHEDNRTYVTSEGASPEEKFESALTAIAGGRMDRARMLIDDVIASDCRGARIYFYWAIAILGSKSQHDLTSKDKRELSMIVGRVGRIPDDSWRLALEVVLDLAGCRPKDVGWWRTWEAHLDALTVEQQTVVNEHLDRLMPSAAMEATWTQRCATARSNQFRDNRRGRIELFFEAEPAEPRLVAPHDDRSGDTQASLPGRYALVAVAALVIGVIAFLTQPLLATAELTAAVATAVAALAFGCRWADRFADLAPSPSDAVPAYTTGQTGFTHQVRQRFTEHFTTYRPLGFDTSAWLALTATERQRLAQEIGRSHRESSTTVENLDWLIQHLAREARDQAMSASSPEASERLSPGAAKVLCIGLASAAGVALLATLVTIVSGFEPSHIGLSLAATLLLIWSLKRAVPDTLEVASEQRRLDREHAERRTEYDSRMAAYRRWKARLEDRPSEIEMQTWLNADKTVFIAEVLDNYRLRWSRLVTYTFLVTPSPPYRKARVKNGPWRYTRYAFHLFLITPEGVREVSTEIDAPSARRGKELRDSYRFDALSSVRVTDDKRAGYNLELTLTNGPAREIHIKDAHAQQVLPANGEPQHDDHEEFSRIDLDATGFVHTFHLLEGIAADGKAWARDHGLPQPSTTPTA